MIHDFVFQNAAEPAAFGRTATEFFVAAHGGAKSFLNKVLRHFRLTNPGQRVAIKTFAVLVHPTSGSGLNVSLIHCEGVEALGSSAPAFGTNVAPGYGARASLVANDFVTRAICKAANGNNNQ